MAKGQNRAKREIRKPKQDKKKPAAQTAASLATRGTINSVSGGKRKT